MELRASRFGRSLHRSTPEPISPTPPPPFTPHPHLISGLDLWKDGIHAFHLAHAFGTGWDRIWTGTMLLSLPLMLTLWR